MGYDLLNFIDALLVLFKRSLFQKIIAFSRIDVNFASFFVSVKLAWAVI